ncbi:hypothetical protein LX16_3415 [Stackebrandtia albiflava]|uniref:Uncharacterized protein n=1 Tax=Stackebrandtia albiflava TaxID=406432 RepID=A0A562V457_9ACTN|nr:hypothetical protein [Stackebrandtia albiflava]TWJ12653.1 hypothetical protein LX16_3415 [Stackebrandtia albiflava]
MSPKPLSRRALLTVPVVATAAATVLPAAPAHADPAAARTDTTDAPVVECAADLLGRH